MPEQAETLELERQLSLEVVREGNPPSFRPANPPLPPVPFTGPWIINELRDSFDRVIVFTDGGASDPRDCRLTVSGSAAFWGKDHPFNFAEPIHGPRQGNDRAELLAVVLALERDSRALHLVTDNSSVQLGAMIRLSLLARVKYEDSKDGDLWSRLVLQLEEREQRGTPPAFSWSKGHVTDDQLPILQEWDTDWTAEEAAFRNGEADRLASEAVQVHESEALATARTDCAERKIRTMQVQRMMVDIALRTFRTGHDAGPDTDPKTNYHSNKPPDPKLDDAPDDPDVLPRARPISDLGEEIRAIYIRSSPPDSSVPSQEDVYLLISGAAQFTGTNLRVVGCHIGPSSYGNHPANWARIGWSS